MIHHACMQVENIKSFIKQTVRCRMYVFIYTIKLNISDSVNFNLQTIKISFKFIVKPPNFQLYLIAVLLKL